MSTGKPAHILVLGGGFGGLHAALELQKAIPGGSLRLTVVNRENFFLFTPMLHEVAASDLDITHIVNPIRKLLRQGVFMAGEVRAIDLARRQVTVVHGRDGHGHELPYDHLVVALGSVTNFFGIPGLREHALTMKTLGDALALRNHVIERLEEADTECAGARREELLTFTVAGGGFAGVETAAAMNDFILEALPHYPRIPRSALRVMLVEAGKHILPELGPGLGGYARRHLARRGVDIRLETRVTGVTGAGVSLSDGSLWPSQTLVWTAGATPSPLVAALPCDKERGRLVVDEYLRVPGYDNLWALGDCAAVPDAGTGLACPPTAQHALRQGRVLAANLVATLSGRPLRPFRFRTLGQLAAIGRRTGVAKVMGVMLSGFPAWWLWRTIYLSKLPRFEKKVRVALDWTLDLLFSKDLVQFLTLRSGGIGEETGPRPVPVGSAAAQREPAAAATRQVVS